MDGMSPNVRRWAPLAGVAVLFSAVVAAASLSTPEVTRLPDTRGEPEQLPQVTFGNVVPPSALPTAPPDGDGVLPAWLSTLFTVVCVTVVVGVVALLVWLWLRERLINRRPGQLMAEQKAGPEVDQRRDVRAAVEEGLAGLDDADLDPRRAVIACWVRLEQAAAAAGTAREVGDTSTELVTRLLGSHQVSAPVLDGLAEVYREARYATHTVDERMRAQARAALRQLRDELSVRTVRSPVGPGEGAPAGPGREAP